MASWGVIDTAGVWWRSEGLWLALVLNACFQQQQVASGIINLNGTKSMSVRFRVGLSSICSTSKVIGRHGCTLPGRVAGWGPCLSLRAPSTCCLESRNLDLNSSIGKLLLGRPAGRQAGRHNTQSHGCRLDRFHRLLLNGMLAPVSMLCILKLSLSRTEDIAIRTRKG